MTDESAAPPPPSDRRAPVARLAEAVASAQAVARESAGDLEQPRVAATGTPADVPSPDPGAPEHEGDGLWDRIGALPALHDDVDGAEGGTDAPAPEVATVDGAVPSTPEPGRPADRRSGDVSRAEGGADEGEALAGDDVAARPVEGDPAGSGGAAGPTRRPDTKRSWPLLVVMALLVAAVPVLAYVGYRFTSDSTTGEVLRGRSKPDAPGYTALVEPTPTALVMQVSASGEARSLTVLSLSGPDQRGGAVLTVPVNVKMRKARVGIETFSGIISVNATGTAGKVIGSELGLGFADTVKVTDAELTRLVAPVAPLKIDNPETVVGADGKGYPEGTIELTAAEVPGYLASTDAGKTVSGRMARQQLVWKAWIAAIADKGAPSAVPGETKVGLGRYLSGLAGGTVQTAPVPVRPAARVDGAPTVRIDRDPTLLLIANAVPLPVAAIPGDRATVALLNGTGPESAPVSVIQRLGYAGAQITTVGNAKTFSRATTTLTYSDPAALPFAKAMARELGVGRIVHSRSADNGVDVAVVMGHDLLDDPPAPLTDEDIADR